jgi:hypothetical protein
LAGPVRTNISARAGNTIVARAYIIAPDADSIFTGITGANIIVITLVRLCALALLRRPAFIKCAAEHFAGSPTDNRLTLTGRTSFPRGAVGILFAFLGSFFHLVTTGGRPALTKRAYLLEGTILVFLTLFLAFPLLVTTNRRLRNPENAGHTFGSKLEGQRKERR